MVATAEQSPNLRQGKVRIRQLDLEDEDIPGRDEHALAAVPNHVVEFGRVKDAAPAEKGDG
jgi:hypothetical protein